MSVLIAPQNQHAEIARVVHARLIAKRIRDRTPEYLARKHDPATIMQLAGMVPDMWQEQVLRSTASRVLINCSRQAGKSTAVAAIVAHMALYQPGSLTILVARIEDQSKEILRKTRAFLATSGLPMPPIADSVTTIELANGSRVLAKPSSEGGVRSYTADLLVVDEAAWVSDAMIASVRPMLAVSRGRFIALTTPHGKQGWFYDAWMHGGDDYERIEVPWQDVPRIQPAFIEAERRALGAMFPQEYECQFLEDTLQVFRTVDIERMVKGVVTWAV